ncbi:hypothetical protein Pst134EA_024069 [Puccinia striiformis f. sp. tritici]|uniref:hypothetical protein n=1 Tax=Puccinia striiformis f. sp. tritici TaxID=168172 RepID=UPI0020088B01|nr:hypothetical protein Pst134EA_024069 [Puccinia striiformis f. sp. tritici]KAH9453182.1 hypothetical protein Pst134EA_024069 [Puccinia striiformis f. sp. tritici]
MPPPSHSIQASSSWSDICTRSEELEIEADGVHFNLSILPYGAYLHLHFCPRHEPLVDSKHVTSGLAAVLSLCKSSLQKINLITTHHPRVENMTSPDLNQYHAYPCSPHSSSVRSDTFPPSLVLHPSLRRELGVFVKVISINLITK